MRSNTSPTSQVPLTAQAARRPNSAPSVPQPHEKSVSGVVVSKRVLTPLERAQAQARLAAQAPQARPPSLAVPAPRQPRPKESAASPSAASSSAKNFRAAGRLALQVARAAVSRTCLYCGKPILGRGVRLDAGPVYVELHRGCADPVKRISGFIEWLSAKYR